MLSALMEIWVWLSPWRSVHWVVEIVPCTRMKSNSFPFPLFRKSALQREEKGSLGLLLWSFLLLHWSLFFLVGSLIELCGYQLHSLMLDTFSNRSIPPAWSNLPWWACRMTRRSRSYAMLPRWWKPIRGYFPRRSYHYGRKMFQGVYLFEDTGICL